MIGAPVFRYYPWSRGEYLPKGTRLIHISDSPEEIARAVAGDSILCDPARACATLVELLPKLRPAKRRKPLKPPPIPEAKGEDHSRLSLLHSSEASS